MSNPSDLELVAFLHGRIHKGEGCSYIPETNVYEKAPWLLQHVKHFVTREQVAHNKKDRSKNVKRKVEGGTWKASGAVTTIKDGAKVVATRQLISFKVNDTKTGWIMHEYVLDAPGFQKLVLCKIKFNSTEANAQYAPRLEPILVGQPQAQEEDRLTLDIPNQHDQPQDHPNLLPVTKKKVKATVSSLRFQQVYSALLRTGIQDVNVYEVPEGSTERHNAFEMEIFVSNDQVDSVIHTITGGARTGHMGDDEISVVPLLNIVDVLNEIHGQANQPMVEHRDHPDPQNLDEIDWSDIDTVLKDVNLDQLLEILQQATDYQHNEHPHAGEANTQYVPQLETTLVGQPQPPLLQQNEIFQQAIDLSLQHNGQYILENNDAGEVNTQPQPLQEEDG